MLVVFLFLIVLLLFAFQSASYIDGISPVLVRSAADTSTNIANIEQRQIRIFQQGIFNLDQTLSPIVTAQDYVLSLDLSGNYSFDTSNKRITIDNSSFSGTLFGIENLAAMHEPQIQMKLIKINNITVSDDFKTISYSTTFVDQNLGDNLTATMSGILQFRNPIAYDEVIDRQNAIRNSSMMKVTLGTILLNPVKSSSVTGGQINEISIN